MPPFEEMDRYQKAVLWVKVGDDADGEPTVSEGEELDVRWEHSQSQARAPDNTLVTLDATVTVDRFIPIDSIMIESELGDVNITATNLDLYQVKTYKSIPSLKNEWNNYVVGLTKFRGKLPTIV